MFSSKKKASAKAAKKLVLPTVAPKPAVKAPAKKVEAFTPNKNVCAAALAPQQQASRERVP